MSLQSEARARSFAAAEEGRRRRKIQGPVLLVLLGLALLAPFERADRRSRGRASQLDRFGRGDRMDGRININEADVTLLRALPGIGPRQAARIRARRELLGPFRNTDDLSRLPGIGNNRLEQLRNLISVEGR